MKRTPLKRSNQQMSGAEHELLRENIRLRGVVSALCGFVSTTRQTNNVEWMHQLCHKVNKALEAIGDTDTIHWDERHDWIYMKHEIERNK